MTVPPGEPGISVEGVWKKFRRGERHDSLRDLLPSLAARLVGRRRDPAALEARDFWALRDVNVEIRPGQSLGIIGHNGAGKSTLLKLITRIMKPTLGRCAVRGRIGALIELAAGFHPDLTGRENVYLQGAIMGMPAAAIRSRFDQIIEFAGVGDFVDTPVKRYSSGMNARLGFAIAAHLEPEVLIIDEVLSVGDLAFQERAFGRMQEIARSGIPVAVVSHQLDRISALSTHAILLRRGGVVRTGTPAECIREYVSGQLAEVERTHAAVPGLQVTGLTAEPAGPVPSGARRPLVLRGSYDPSVAGPRRLAFLIRVRRMETGHVVYTTWTHRHGVELAEGGPFEIRFDLQFNLPPGVVAVESAILDANTERPIGEGPWAHIEISAGLPFQGEVQMSSEVTLLDG
jgi:lipopolysaccharide transport system ATP-binding protein